MKLEICCACCGKEKTIVVKPLHDDIMRRSAILVDQAIEKAGWLTQQNGDNFDVYCSEKCAA